MNRIRTRSQLSLGYALAISVKWAEPIPVWHGGALASLVRRLRAIIIANGYMLGCRRERASPTCQSVTLATLSHPVRKEQRINGCADHGLSRKISMFAGVCDYRRLCPRLNRTNIDHQRYRPPVLLQFLQFACAWAPKN